jgi:hypothetical protein
MVTKPFWQGFLLEVHETYLELYLLDGSGDLLLMRLVGRWVVGRAALGGGRDA